MKTWTAVAVVVLGCAAVAALVRRDEEADAGRERSRLASAAWVLTIAALLSAAARILIIH